MHPAKVRQTKSITLTAWIHWVSIDTWLIRPGAVHGFVVAVLAAWNSWMTMGLNPLSILFRRIGNYHWKNTVTFANLKCKWSFYSHFCRPSINYHYSQVCSAFPLDRYISIAIYRCNTLLSSWSYIRPLSRFHWPFFLSLPLLPSMILKSIIMVPTKSAHMINSCLPGRLPELALRPGRGIVTMSKAFSLWRQLLEVALVMSLSKRISSLES